MHCLLEKAPNGSPLLWGARRPAGITRRRVIYTPDGANIIILIARVQRRQTCEGPHNHKRPVCLAAACEARLLDCDRCGMRREKGAAERSRFGQLNGTALSKVHFSRGEKRSRN